ncbi:hypothetical protein GCM10027188_08180 [Lysobacter humi (ex Lee et al. 2017)]
MSLLDQLPLATSRIGNTYFRLPIAGERHGIRRERVYCYELYHQLRTLLTAEVLTLTGEPDKRGRSDFPGINPDFILHAPGTHESNSVVMEVECRVGYRHIVKDLNNLLVMRRRGYQTLVLLLFAVEQVPWPMIWRAAEEVAISTSDFLVYLHRRAGEPAAVVPPPSSVIAAEPLNPPLVVSSSNAI